MAGFTWVRGTPDQFVSSPQRAVQKITEGFDMQSIVEKAAEAMRLIIQTSGTGKTWTRPSSSGRTGSSPGRVDTGNMLDAVKWRVSSEGGNLVGEFGWLDNQEPYFMYQESGFSHVGSGEWVRGMLALQDASLAAKEEFLTRLANALRR